MKKRKVEKVSERAKKLVLRKDENSYSLPKRKVRYISKRRGKMKKTIILMFFLSFFFGLVSPAASATPGRGFKFGVNIGAFPTIWAFNSYRFGGEVSYQLADRLAIVGEFAYRYTTRIYELKDKYYSSSIKMNYSSVPISASLILITSAGRGFSTYIGSGLGYYSTTIKRDWTRQSRYSGTTSRTESDRISGFAPHFSIGIKSAVSNRIVIFGEVKQIVGKPKSKEREEYRNLGERDKSFGGPEVKIGVRYYFKD